MTDLNRFLAEKVLGWTEDDYGWLDKDGLIIGWTVREGNPGLPNFMSSWADCEPLLNQIERDKWVWSWSFSGSDYMFTIKKYEPRVGFSEIHRIRTEALCKAIAKAYGWEERC